MSYRFTNAQLLEIEYKIPKYNKYIFFEKRNKYALLIPVINEGERFISQMNKMKEGNIFNICDVFICDGGSKDNSSNPDFIKEYGCCGLIINVSGKRGQGVQLKQGFYKTMINGYDGAIMVDGNDKDNVHESLPLFLEKLEEGYDVVQATRFTLGGKEENTPFLRNIGIRLIASPLISLSSHFHYDDVCNGYKGFSRNYILDKRMDWFRDEFNTYEYCYYPLVHVKKLGYKACQVPTTRVYPKNEVPSKIKGFSSNFKLLNAIFSLAISKTRPDQTRPDQTRPDQTRPEIICNDYIYIFIIIQNIKNYKLCCKLQHSFFVL
ncbi:glycosyltransferase family 2 protein [Brachyspira innocens]|uniref:glycosyltransferase family 2 protein n=1 Tax=Brachyspira innocens TaxID=13264 RepID=UPI0026ECB87F|nr:glycosyltransferase family 2 protein [Brachyspira innocens]